MTFQRHIVFVYLLLSICVNINAQELAPWNETDNLPRWMTPSEELRKHEIGQNFEATTVRSGAQFRSIAEYERMEGALIRFPLGIPIQLVKAMSEHVKVYTLVATPTRREEARNIFSNNGVDLDNCEFIIAPTNSMWTRDYGPWYVASEDHEIEIVDFIYNRPRASDNAIPTVVADYLEINRNGMGLIHCGGNFMSDGSGAGMSTDLVIEENGFQESMVRDVSFDFLGLHTYHITEDAQGEYIRHIDTWAKMLAPDKILIAQVPEISPRYSTYEEIADYYSQQLSAYGTPIQVFRVFSPQGQPYTNSLILNERVYVPITGSAWDEDALNVYRTAMPGYEVLGFQGSWISTDALHCRIKELADRQMIYIDHHPLAEEIFFQDSLSLSASIISYSKQPIHADSTFLIFKINQGELDTLLLPQIQTNDFFIDLPVQWGDTLISYFIATADMSGKKETWPLIGAAGSRNVQIQYQPLFSITPKNTTVNLEAPLSFYELLITNEIPRSSQIDSISFSPNNLIAWELADQPLQFPLRMSAGKHLPVFIAPIEDFELPEGEVVVDTVLLWSGNQTFLAFINYENSPSTRIQTSAFNSSVKLYPNPFSNQISIDLEIQTATSLSIKIGDLYSGYLRPLTNIDLSAGKQTFTFDIQEDLPTGIYFIQLDDGQDIIHIPVIKSH